MNIARLTPSFAMQYRTLMLQAYAGNPDAFTSTVAERSALPLSWWENRLSVTQNPIELVFAALEDGQLLGTAGLSFDAREQVSHKSTLFGMYVAPAHRGCGIGHQLVCAALDCARARSGIKLVQLTVTQGNHKAEELYGRCGFVQFGVEPFAVAVGDGFVSKVHMWCDLNAANGSN